MPCHNKTGTILLSLDSVIVGWKKKHISTQRDIEHPPATLKSTWFVRMARTLVQASTPSLAPISPVCGRPISCYTLLQKLSPSPLALGLCLSLALQPPKFCISSNALIEGIPPVYIPQSQPAHKLLPIALCVGLPVMLLLGAEHLPFILLQICGWGIGCEHLGGQGMLRVIVRVAVMPLVARRALDGRLPALLPAQYPAPIPLRDVGLEGRGRW
mmetsp:Transcript_28254/g.76293  ORF Transcript_28254/g.76293 Transcript_28254/m.76293 type:complete len:214 (-) Transcript_28254:366-1007(-)